MRAMLTLGFLAAVALCVVCWSFAAISLPCTGCWERKAANFEAAVPVRFMRFGRQGGPRFGRSSPRTYFGRRGRTAVNGSGRFRGWPRPAEGGRAAGNPGGRRGWQGGVRPAPVALGVYGPGSALILGFGGSRPPIAPPSSLPPQGRPVSIVDALLRGKRYRPDELIIEMPNEAGDELREALARQYGVEIRDLGTISFLGTRLFRLKLRPGQSLRALLARLLEDRRVTRAQPNYIYTPVQGAPQPPRKGVGKSGEDFSGRDVKVAVIDTCMDRHHPEIEGSVSAFYDAVSPGAADCNPEDHGTAVASLITGHVQIHGPAQGAFILAARAFTHTAGSLEPAEGTSAEIVLSLNWAVAKGAQVANMSFAGPSDPLLERAVAAAYREGIVLVAAAGNAGPESPPLYPAAYPETVAVTACDARRHPYAAANRGAHIAISARGVDVLVAHSGNAYATESGTSFAAATVSGVIAVMRQMRPRASPDEVKTALVNTAVAIEGSGNDRSSGHGLLDAKAAVAYVEANVSQ